MGALKVVTLIPWRGGDELREQSWEVVRPYLEALGYPVYAGDRDGPWSRGAAINAAAADAGGWDVAVIGDADSILVTDLDAAISRALASGGAIRPHDHLCRLTPSGSIAIARKGVEGLEPRHIGHEFPGGGFLVIAREGWDRIGGYDERYVGWGHEDSDLNTRLIIKADWDIMPGVAYHLFHPDETRRTREYMRNRQMLHRLRHDNARALAEISRERGYNVEAVL